MPKAKKKKSNTPSKTFKTLAKKTGKSLDDLDRYYKSGVASAKRQKAKGKKIRDPHEYAMAVTMKRIYRTGPRTWPHHTKRKKSNKAAKEGFEKRLDNIIEMVIGQ